MIKLQNNVKKIRKEKGITQQELAELCNLSRSRIADIEGTKSKPERISLGTAFMLAEILETDIISLFSTKDSD